MTVFYPWFCPKSMAILGSDWLMADPMAQPMDVSNEQRGWKGNHSRQKSPTYQLDFVDFPDFPDFVDFQKISILLIFLTFRIPNPTKALRISCVTCQHLYLWTPLRPLDVTAAPLASGKGINRSFICFLHGLWSAYLLERFQGIPQTQGGNVKTPEM